MATRPKDNLGKMACPCCGEPVSVKKSRETGTLTYACQDADCEATGYASAHTAAARRWLANITPPKGATQAPPKEPEPAPKPQAAPGAAKKPATKVEAKPPKQTPPAAPTPPAPEKKGGFQWKF